MTDLPTVQNLMDNIDYNEKRINDPLIWECRL
nr:Uncharacterised protein [Providencia rettgeri]